MNLHNRLEELYKKYNDPGFIHPDPLEFVHKYKDPADREVAALVASSLAYGRVKQILAAVSSVLDLMGPSPFGWLKATPDRAIRDSVVGFRHRFAAEGHMACLLIGAKRALNRHDSLENCFLSGWHSDFDTVLPALPHFVNQISDRGNCGHLLPDPDKGSSCKRINLMLRWLVRHDAVDPGGWQDIPAAALVVPLDTHMKKIGIHLGFTTRSGADMRTALEITEGFRKLSPDDPVKYDFALTRLGIRKDGDINDFLASI